MWVHRNRGILSDRLTSEQVRRAGRPKGRRLEKGEQEEIKLALESVMLLVGYWKKKTMKDERGKGEGINCEDFHRMIGGGGDQER